MICKHSILFVLLSLFYFIMGTPTVVNGAADCTKAREWYEKGISAKDNREKAIFYYKKAIDLCPDYTEAYINLSKHYMMAREFEKATNVCRSGLDNDPLSPDLHFILGNANEFSGKFEKAKVEYEKATELNPEVNFFWKRLGMLYLYILYTNYDAASNAFEKAYSLKAEANTLGLWSVSYYRMDDYSNAIAKARLCIEKFPKEPYGYNMLSWIYSSSKDAKYINGKKAIDYANKVQQLAGIKSWTLATLAAAHARNNDFVAAVSAEAKSIEMLEVSEWPPLALKKVTLKESRFRLKLYEQRIPYTNGDYRP